MNGCKGVVRESCMSGCKGVVEFEELEIKRSELRTPGVHENI